jgi:hypothetical protein
MMNLQKNPGAVRRFGWLMRFAGWLQTLPDKLTPPPFRLLQIGSAFWQSRALATASKLDIAGVLADQTLTADEIARRIDANPDALHRLLRMLAALGVFEEVAPRCFRNNRISDSLRTDRPDNLRAMVLMHNSDEMSRPWYEQLEQAVRAGAVPFELAHNQALFRYLDSHEAFDRLFAQAMDSVEALTGDSHATDFAWDRFERILDIGGSKGAKSLAILRHHPHLHALVFDRAQVIEQARHYWQGKENESVLSRLAFQAGDLLESVPEARSARDIYLLSAVLHGFDDETSIRILHNLASAGRPVGALIAIMELVLPETTAGVAETSFDMQMFVGTRGRERTLAEWERLFRLSGVSLVQIVKLRSLGQILVLRPES